MIRRDRPRGRQGRFDDVRRCTMIVRITTNRRSIAVPIAEPIRKDPRYAGFARRVGLPPLP
jgi:hypothetical protein